MLALGITPSDVIEHLLEEKSFPQLESVLIRHCGLDLKSISGPHEPSGCFHWSLRLQSGDATTMEGHPALDGGTGVAAYVIDCLTSFHMLLIESRKGHVTINLSVSCIRQLPVGKPILVRTFVRSNTSSAIIMDAVFVDPENEAMDFVTGQHTKMFYRLSPSQSKKARGTAAKL